jgi:hypothetical protein
MMELKLLQKHDNIFQLTYSYNLKLSDVMVGPILLYVSEIWGYENKKIIEQVLHTYYGYLMLIH